MVEVLSSENGSWTIFMTSANGVSCLMATGEHWRELPKQKAEMALYTDFAIRRLFFYP